MSDQFITLQLEIPPGVDQEEVWKLEEQLGQVAGITTELREPRDPAAETLLFIHVMVPYVVQAVAVAGAINTLDDFAQHIYNFLHQEKKQEIDQKPGKKKVVIITKGKKGEKRTELYGFSLEEIKKLIEQ